jgi:hypothetical protein
MAGKLPMVLRFSVSCVASLAAILWDAAECDVAVLSMLACVAFEMVVVVSMVVAVLMVGAFVKIG